MLNYLKSLYIKYKMKYTNTNTNDKYDIYYNKVFDRYMYYKQCQICKYNIYVFQLDEFKQHEIECFKFHTINIKRIYFN